jgi:hypothetical protein
MAFVKDTSRIWSCKLIRVGASLGDERDLTSLAGKRSRLRVNDVQSMPM